MKPIITWEYSLVTEADRIINTVSHTTNHFFAIKNFMVLPYLVSGNGQTVYLPDLNFDNKFLRFTSRLTPQIPITKDIRLINKVKSRLLSFGWNEPTNQILECQKSWNKIETLFLAYTSVLFPKVKPKQINIIPTLYGTLSSFDLKNNIITAVIRLDMDISHLAEAIISGILMYSFVNKKQDWYSDNGLNWEEKEAYIDGLMITTGLKELFPKYRGTLDLTDNKNFSLSTDSRKYLKKLGVSTGKLFTLVNNQVEIDNHPVSKIFTPNEMDVLKYLLINTNKVCSNEAIGEIIWTTNTDNKYSLWAIAKTIQRIRDKLIGLGISSQVIQTKRKEGYYLVN